jgi:hypothetical protein
MITETAYAMSVFVMDVRPKPGLKRIVDEKDEKGICLLCEHEAFKRGLCQLHYGRYRTARLEQPARERLAFDAELIKEGQLLPSRAGQPRDTVNEFRR